MEFVGYLLPTRDHVARGDHEVSPLVRLARRAEELGFDSVWAGDSPLTRPRADPLTLLAAVAAVTERVTLGTAVLLPALRHPILLAHQLATVDRIADGRLVVGVGGGFPHPNTEAQFAALQVDFSTRISRLTESVDIIRQLWTSTGVSFQGRHFAFDDVAIGPRPARAGGPPIWLAGSGDAALRRVARLADGWLPYSPSPRTYARELAMIRRPVTPALYATLCVDDDVSLARKRMRTHIERYYNFPLELVEQIQAMFAGTAREAADWLRGYVDAGARHVVVRLAADDHDAALERFAASVLPLLREGVPA
ncbi:LLM class flavin-dependent oxidoreductase [Actinophytocola sp.]|uniref:LLM class flavin-dependent oxidoreductase n=1 Tax=Actinophytocola sp. TaxID=1872138 RepID=UPI002D51E08F|nr:LLM class flavin-dependent oxidoreductase [Actinophytocola sp.]HYQ63093.1 LLM class flavin-dependent oxidoreductase [Actinophytocola sp.]